MSVRGPNNGGRVVQTDPTLLRYASAITEQKKCLELFAEKFERFQTLGNNIQQHGKWYPFQVEPLRIGHQREYPSGIGQSL